MGTISALEPLSTLEPFSFGQHLPPTQNSTPKLLCREIRPDDIGPLIDLLTRGFVAAGHDFWERVFECLSSHPTPLGFPRYGYLLESEGTPVGVLLLIFTAVPTSQGHSIRCNVSSWYVDPSFRPYASMLVSVALKRRDVTYLNVSAATSTWPILEAQGYKKFSSGRIVAIPGLSGRRMPGCRVERINFPLQPDKDLTDFEIRLLQSHAQYGCISLICHAGGERFPFVFRLRPKYGLIPFLFLIYCRNLESFVRFARPLGVYLACRGMPLVVLDANGPIPGLFGSYQSVGPKYFKGPEQPPLGDLSYTERAMFGV